MLAEAPLQSEMCVAPQQDIDEDLWEGTATDSCLEAKRAANVVPVVRRLDRLDWLIELEAKSQYGH
jgi:hypothetical protein